MLWNIYFKIVLNNYIYLKILWWNLCRLLYRAFKIMNNHERVNLFRQFTSYFISSLLFFLPITNSPPKKSVGPLTVTEFVR